MRGAFVSPACLGSHRRYLALRRCAARGETAGRAPTTRRGKALSAGNQEGMRVTEAYVNYRSGSIGFDDTERTFACAWGDQGAFLGRGQFTVRPESGQAAVTGAAFATVTCRREDVPTGRQLTVCLTQGPAHLPQVELVFVAGRDSIRIEVRAPGLGEVELSGDLHWGADSAHSTFAVRLERTTGDLRVGCGPAVSALDNALFDRLTDTAVEALGPARTVLCYDWQRQCYHIRANTAGPAAGCTLELKVHEHYFARKFAVPYRPVRGETQFKTPPIGWMTWYAVKFNASEAVVLENARWQAEHLGPYGANCIWVDWEWYHSKLDTAVPELPDIDTFSPDPRRYPHGMKYVADEIRKLGLAPAIWIGPTNDPNRNRFLLEHPDCILAEQPAWCGRWWLDPSHPEVIGTYIPAVFRQLLDWGYEAFKWDIMPMSLWIADQHHARFHTPTLTPEAALRGLVQAARDVIGPARYMMSCSGHVLRDIALAIDLFDGGRIGGDIFKWEEYVKQAVERAYTYLCFNNILFYADLDNVVIRDEFNTLDQATSRVSFTALTGTPITLGDHLPALPPERVELLRRIMPALDIHPMDLDEHALQEPVALLNLVVARPFEQWNVVDVFNTTGEVRQVHLDLAAALHLPCGRGEAYLVFDFWQRRFLGTYEQALDLDLGPYVSTVLCVRRRLDRPQVLSTSRHISQGGHDLLAVTWDAARRLLSGSARLVGGEAYVLSLYVPCGVAALSVSSSAAAELSPAAANVATVTLQPAVSGDVEWSVTFRRDDIGAPAPA